MSNFNCEKCGAYCADSERGYTTGCEHYPPDIKPLRGFGFTLDIKTGLNRKWFVDDFGAKRWIDDKRPAAN